MYQKSNQPVSEVGTHYTVEQVNAFPVPEFKDLMGYADSVRARTLEYLKDITPNQLDKVITLPRWGKSPVPHILPTFRSYVSTHWLDIISPRPSARNGQIAFNNKHCPRAILMLDHSIVFCLRQAIVRRQN